jgi:N-methylhydantoinase A/oxoprolinase/acetone carboxylase beta subunit
MIDIEGKQDMRFAVDTAGTFADWVVEDNAGKLYIFKVPTAHQDPGEGMKNILRGERRGFKRASRLF